MPCGLLDHDVTFLQSHGVMIEKEVQLSVKEVIEVDGRCRMPAVLIDALSNCRRSWLRIWGDNHEEPARSADALRSNRVGKCSRFYSLDPIHYLVSRFEVPKPL